MKKIAPALIAVAVAAFTFGGVGTAVAETGAKAGTQVEETTEKETKAKDTEAKEMEIEVIEGVTPLPRIVPDGESEVTPLPRLVPSPRDETEGEVTPLPRIVPDSEEDRPRIQPMPNPVPLPEITPDPEEDRVRIQPMPNPVPLPRILPEPEIGEPKDREIRELPRLIPDDDWYRNVDRLRTGLKAGLEDLRPREAPAKIGGRDIRTVIDVVIYLERARTNHDQYGRLYK